METNNKSQDEINNIANRIKNALTREHNDTNPESVEAEQILAELSKNNDFEQDIEQILACLNEQTPDLTKLQTQIILLIKKYLGKKNLNLTIDEKLINKNIAEVSSYLMQQHSTLVKEINKGLKEPKDKLQGINAVSKANLQRLIKGFAVYQIYMFMNPKRIAGETRKENFAHNMIHGGMHLASHYAGGTKSEIAAYSPTFIKKLEKAHTAFNRGGRTIS